MESAAAIETLTRGALRLFRVGRNVAIADCAMRRASRDYQLWIAERDSELQQQLNEIDDDFEGRGLYSSGARLEKRAEAKAAARREHHRKRMVLEDLAEDLRNNQTFLERGYRRLRGRPPQSPTSVAEEEQLAAGWRDPEVDPEGDVVVEIPD